MGWKHRKKRGGADQHHPQAGLIARQGHKHPQLPKRRTHRGHRGRGHDERKWQERTGASSPGYKPPPAIAAPQQPELAASQPAATQSLIAAQDRPGGQTGQQQPASQPASQHQANPGTTGAGGEPETRLFESVAETIPDQRLVRRAIRKRWDTPKQLTEVVIQKHLTLAAGLPWRGPDGVERRVEYTPNQLQGACQTALYVDARNQSEEHHADRMEFAERALQIKSKVGEYKPPVGGIGVETTGPAKIAIYLPDHRRDGDEIDAVIQDVLRPDHTA